MNKYDHVRQAKQTRSHTCHWPDCKKQVPPAMWGCYEHWRRLPMRLRVKIWANYVAGQEERQDPTMDYVKAAREVEDWIDAQVLL